MKIQKIVFLSSLFFLESQAITLQPNRFFLTNNYLNTSIKHREKRQDSDEVEDLELSCNFGQNSDLTFCDWVHPKNASDRFRWQVNRGSRYLLLGGPENDRTSADYEGGYAVYETSLYPSDNVDDNIADNALLLSPNISRTEPQGTCLTFYYSIEGLSADKLRILLYRHADKSMIPLWESSDIMTENWQKGEVVYAIGEKHQIVFEALPKKLKDSERCFRGYIAIDDIESNEVGSDSSENCLGHCTFEGGFCGWVNLDEEEEDDFDWTLSRGSQSYLTGPCRDFTSFNKDIPTGGYASIENAKPRKPGDRAELVSPLFQATGDSNPVCMRFATHMFGNGVGILRVKQQYQLDDENVERVLWEIGGDAGNHWYMAQVSVSSPSPYKLLFEGIVGKNTMGTIAIDNISFRPGSCPIYPQTAAELSADCNFEENICNWINSPPQAGEDDFDWNRIQNYAHVQSLPLIDHTTGTSEGFFMALSNTSPLPLRGGTRAWLISPNLPAPEGPRCIEFYYYMFERTIDSSGPNLGSTRVYTRPALPEQSLNITPIWRLINHQRRQWLRARAAVVIGPERQTPTEPFQVIIEGLWGHGSVGAIAIDDISFFDGDCGNYPNDGTPIRGECFFDKDTCDWSDRTIAPPTYEYGIGERGASVRWRLATSISRPANVFDRTFGGTTGFVFFDVFNQQRIQKPILRSPILKNSDSGVRCFSFWFVKFGRGADTSLAVQLVDLSESESEKLSLLWKVGGKEKNHIKTVEWTYAQVEIRMETDYALQFHGESADGGFAIDDITFNDVKCSIRPPTAKPIDEESENESD
ncbi:MAM and LDL-receptor class A domain-containing protein 1-like [Centruroides sculpturatus]|uniref:MAM and LDL-receptor class A domain-containing protein 1-like n=1 Tax=Centruroides sculpturatus TaxID=218467 RepID=UPI000C6EABCF|nr:MAM and LDL-receptor class A domain-containing protein 1-like [Centruroides sculpturatus]XP_023224462.1 MAM and LDL-receptor class A domain-containing protein 1-like [Centruroides sculpturatus]